MGAIIKVEKENNLQKMLGTNINKEVSYYEIQVAAKAGQGFQAVTFSEIKNSTVSIL